MCALIGWTRRLTSFAGVAAKSLFIGTLTASLMGGCGGPTELPLEPPPVQHLNLSSSPLAGVGAPSTTLAFGHSLDDIILVVPNEWGDGTGFGFQSDADWCLTSPPSGELQGPELSVHFLVRRDGLAPGSYAAQVTLFIAGSPTAVIAATMTVGEPEPVPVDKSALTAEISNWEGWIRGPSNEPEAPALLCDTDVFNFGRAGIAGEFQIRSGDGSEVAFSIQKPAEMKWLSLEPKSGVVGDEPLTVSVYAWRRYLVDGWGDAGDVAATTLAIEADGETLEVEVRAQRPPVEDDAELAAKLAQLPPLPKPHFHWPIDRDRLDALTDPLVYEYTRITHSVGLSLFGLQKSHIEGAVQVCKQVNATNPAIPATIALNYSPFHYFMRHRDPWDRDSKYDAEFELAEEYFSDARRWLADANDRYNTDVRIATLMLDTEVWYRRDPGEPDAEAWNQAMSDNFNRMYDLAKSYYPDAIIEWFERGPEYGNWHDPADRGDTMSMAAYWPTNLARARALATDVHEAAQAYDVEHRFLWISLASGWVYLNTRDVWLYYSDWDYPTSYSHRLGEYLNHPKHADPASEWHALSRMDYVSLYPVYLSPESPNMPKHFRAYVAGAHGLPLPAE
jgi:hypothetical protein